jgi:hypothetical protein
MVPFAIFTKDSGKPPIPSKPVEPASPERVREAPAYKKELPNVITSGLTWVMIIKSPFSPPANKPPSNPDAIANPMFDVPTQMRPVITAESPIIEPTEMSIPPDTIISVMGSAAMAI